MKIAWFTPFFRNSAIGKYSQAVTQELKKHCELDIWVPSGDGSLLDTNLKVIRFDSAAIRNVRLADYDFIIYNMGDHLDFHRSIYEVSSAVKGIVIVHDFVLHHFFAGYYLLHLKDQNAYIREMGRLYGKEGLTVADESLRGVREHIWETDNVVKYPFFEKAIEGALGVIVQSRFLADEVKKSYLGPVGCIYHPFSLDKTVPVIPKDRIQIPQDNNKVQMLTLGYINPNKRIDKVIKAIGESKSLSAKIHYVVIGSYDHNGTYFSSLQSLVQKYRLQECVSFLSYQPDETLYAYLSRADVCINLRFPAMEGASWSLIEQLHYGKAVIVTDTGFYHELPNDCVLKVNPEKENEDLTALLKKVVNNPNFRETTGKKGKEFAVSNFTSSRYCENFLRFCENARAYRPLMELTDRVGKELSLMKVTENMDAVCAASSEIYRMFKKG
jgi:glycosyltransferase involved in cell wall biosynthesis